MTIEDNASQARIANFIDAHVHIWTNDFQKYPLERTYQPQDMQPRTFFPEEILAHAWPNGVGRIVLIQMSYYGFDNSYLLDAMARWPEIFTGVAVIDWNADHPEVQMRELARRGVRGFRIFPQDLPAQTCLEADGIDRMFRCGAEENLAMCLLVNPEALGAVYKKCERFPSTPVIIDHIARIGMSGPIEEADVRTLCALAHFPNVKVKISAFYALGEKKPPHKDLIPLIKQVYEAFGEHRLMWGSDCPFQTEAETYQDSISVVRDNLPFLTNDAREWILRRTAEKAFFA